MGARPEVPMSVAACVAGGIKEMIIAACTALVLDAAEPADKAVLDRLRADPVIELIDHSDAQLEEVRKLLPPPDPELVAEPCRWAYYPWRRIVVAVLAPRAFRAVRLDRNRNMITAEEQARLGALRIGVAGLSVGHIIAHTLAAQGMCGELRLADFDRLELSNLNRVPATVFDLGVNKAEAAARRIAELDPSDKLSPSLTHSGSVQAIIEFHPDITPAQQDAVLAAAETTGSRPAPLIASHVLVTATFSQLEILAADDSVAT